MTHDSIGRAIDAAGDAPITAKQLRLCILAALRAWRVQSKLLDVGTFDEFRHGALFDAIHRTSFRTIRQKDYSTVQRHFASLAGTTWRQQEARTVVPAADDRRRALYVLSDTIARLADRYGGQIGADAYANALFDRIYHTTRDRASVRQIWGVIFTLSNRKKKGTHER